MPKEPNVDEEREMAAVVRWKRREALEAGMELGDAQRFAHSDIPLEELRRRIKQGVPAEWLAGIVL